MVTLDHLSLTNFKNYTEGSFTFQHKVNCIVGRNGAGKTNLLDAIYYLCLTKSYFNSIDYQNIRHGQDFFALKAKIKISNEINELRCLVSREKSKEFSYNGVKYEKLADHVGVIPVVIAAPNDIVLIHGGSEERRKFLDGFIAQIDKEYLIKLQQYNRLLSQRNALLKNFAETGRFDVSLLQVYGQKMIQPGDYIFKKRQSIVQEFIPVFKDIYQKISGNQEEVVLDYHSQLIDRSFNDLLDQNLDKDKILRRTTTGVHKDDLNFLMDGHVVKRFGSQGQQKSFLISIKLAQYQLLKEYKGVSPLLLLDDIFDKLDFDRSQNLLKFISEHHFGQIFITDTQRTRIEKIFKDELNEIGIISMEEEKVY